MRSLATIFTLILSVQLWGQTFTATQEITGVTESKGTIWLDWDDDGDMDLFLRGINSSGQIISELYDNDNGVLNKTILNLPALSGGKSQQINFNPDAFPDLVISGYDENLEFKCLLLINDGVTFELSPIVLPSLTNGGIEVFDINQNGLPVIIFYGINSSDEAEVKVLEMQSNTLTEIETNIPGFYNGNLQPTDFNKDGYTDLLINGTSSKGGHFIQILKGKGDYHFEKQYPSIPNYLQSSVRVHDFNQDGFQDLIVSGILEETYEPKTLLYFGTTTGFINSNVSLPDLAFGENQVLDFNNDGSSDLLLSGFNSSSQFQNIIVESDFNQNYTLNFSFEELRNGSVTTADINNDGNPEVLISGIQNGQRKSILYSNNSTPSNSVDPPVQITVNQINDTAVIKWDAPSTETNLGTQINYNLKLTLQNGDHQYFTSHSNIYRLNHLEEGTYEIQIQAIDNSNIASTYSSAIEFTICSKPDIGVDKSICVGENIQFETEEIGDYEWISKNEGVIGTDKLIEYKPSKNDSIFLKVIKSNGCINYDTAFVEVNPVPVLAYDSKIESCIGSHVELTPPPFKINTVTSLALGEISRDNSNLIDFEISQVDTLLFEAANEYGCTIKDSVFIAPLPIPEIITPKNTELCFGDSLTLHSPYDETTWFSVLNNQTISQSNELKEVFTKSDLIEVTVTDENGCTNSSKIEVHVNPLPQFSLGPDLEICFRDTLNLSTGLNYPKITWNDQGLKKSEDKLTYEYVANNSGEVVAQVENAFGCSNADTLFVNVNPLPTESLQSGYTICKDQSFEFNIEKEYSKMNWKSNLDGLFSTDKSINRLFDISDIITLSLKDQKGCENQYSSQIIVQETPLPDLGEDIILCKDDQLTLGFKHGYSTTKWEIQNEFIESDSLKIAVIDSLDVKVFTTDSLGCKYSDSIRIIPIPKPESPFIPEAIICSNDTLKLQKSSNIEIDWLKRNTASVIERPDAYHISSQKSDTLHYTVKQGSCSNASFIKLQVKEIEEFPLLNAYDGCEGDSITLELPENWSVEWDIPGFDKVLGRTLTQFFDENKEISIEFTDSNSCFQERQIKLNVNPLPLVDAGENQLICSSQQVILGPVEANPDLLHHWIPSSGLSQNNIPNPLAYPDKSTKYSLKTTDTNGCSSIDTVSVLLDSKTEISLGNTYEICKGDSVILGGNPIASGSLLRYNYDWSPNQNISFTESGNPIVWPDETTTYQVMISTGPCIIDTSFVEVIVHELPSINAGDDFTAGHNEWFQLEATGAVKYNWSPSQYLDFNSISNPKGQLNTSTQFIVEGRDSNQCIGVDTVKVVVENKLFIPNIFTPNGDGINDYFTLRGFGIDEIDFKIISPSGQVVYTISEPEELGNFDWDGRYRNRELPEGYYSWVITGNFMDKSPFFNERITTGKLYLKR